MGATPKESGVRQVRVEKDTHGKVSPRLKNDRFKSGNNYRLCIFYHKTRQMVCRKARLTGFRGMEGVFTSSVFQRKAIQISK